MAKIPEDYLELSALREAEEKRFEQAGEQLLELIPPEDWAQANREERMALLKRAHDFLRPVMRVNQPTEIEIRPEFEPGDAEGMGYDEERRGVIVVAEAELDGVDAGKVFAGLAHEMRHAYQDEVVHGEQDDPRKPLGHRQEPRTTPQTGCIASTR